MEENENCGFKAPEHVTFFSEKRFASDLHMEFKINITSKVKTFNKSYLRAQ